MAERRDAFSLRSQFQDKFFSSSTDRIQEEHMSANQISASQAGQLSLGRELTVNRGKVLREVADAHQAQPMQVALAWLLWRSPIVLPIPGTSSLQHLEQNVAAAALKLTDEECKRLYGVPELVGAR